MQGGNRFLDFANEIMARHRGLGFGFEPASMLHLEDQQQVPMESAAASNNYVTNLYHIQNIKEENYLFKQNLSFLTQVLENKIYKNLYPSVEKQIEKVIREEMPQAETKMIHSVSEQLLKLVQQGGIEIFYTVKDKVLSEYKETEKITLKEQEKLFRKIENIWNSSIYQQTVQNYHQDITKSNIKNIHQSFFDKKNNTYHQTLQQNKQQNQYVQQIYLLNQNQSVQQNDQLNQYQNVQQNDQLNQYQNVQQNDQLNQYQNVQHNYSLNQYQNVQQNFQLNQNQPIHQNQQIQQIEIIHPENYQTEIFQTEISNEKALNNSEKVKENHYIENQQSLYNESVLERTLKVIESQTQMIQYVQNQHIGNIGELYENIHISNVSNISMNQPVYNSDFIERGVIDSKDVIVSKNVEHHIERVLMEHVQEPSDILRENTLQMIDSQLPHKTNKVEQMISVRQDHIHLEYPTEETTQVQQEIMELLHSEIQRIPEVPLVVKEVSEKHLKTIEKQSKEFGNILESVSTEESKTLMIEKTKSISEQILSRMENIINVPVFEKNSVTNSVTKTVTLNKLSHAILEYAEEKTSSEQLQSNMLRILEDYQTEVMTLPGERSTRQIYNNQAELLTIETIKNNMNHRILQNIRNKGNVPVLIQAMEPAAIVYRSEETQTPEQSEKTKQLEKQVNEVVKTVKNVEQKTIVQKEQLIEQQRKVVREVLKENSDVWTEGNGAGYIRNEVQHSVEEQINQSVNQIANRVYRRLEEKLKSERGRRGLI